MAVLFSFFPNPSSAIQNPNLDIPKPLIPNPHFNSKRQFILKTTTSLCITLIPQLPVAQSSAESLPSKSLLSSIENTKSWFQFYGDGFAIRVPPEFQDIMEPEVDSSLLLCISFFSLLYRLNIAIL